MKFIVRTTGDRDISALKEAIPDLIATTKGDNAMEGFIYALDLAEGDSCVHMEDDIILADGFKKKVREIISMYPNDVIQFFSMRKDDLTTGTRWIPGRRFCMGQCFYLPAGMSEGIRAYYDAGWKRISEHPTGLDLMVADYLGDNRLRYLNIVPNLVDHQQVKSLIDPRRSTKRQSYTFRRS